jgi:hypothetical protein
MSRADIFDNLIGHRRGKYFEIDPSSDPRLAEITATPDGNGFYGSIFEREFGWLLPYDRGGEPTFTVDLKVDDAAVRDLVIDSLPTLYPAHSLREGVRDFSNDCAQLLLYGPVAIEIEHFSHTDGTLARNFALHFLPAGTVRFRRRAPIQLVPKSLSSAKYRGFRYVDLDPSLLVVIDLDPTARATLRKALRVFRLADEQHFLAVDLLTGGDKRFRGFDPQEHRRRLQKIVLSETRQLGWAESLDGEVLDPYKVWRHLQFLRFQIGVRRTILSGLQEAIQKAGLRSGFSAELLVDGLVEYEAVDAAANNLVAGTSSIASLLRL